jgi:hypothetical protein
MDVSEENEMNELLKEALEALEEAVGTIEGLDGRDNSCDEKLDLGDFRKTIAKLTAALSSVEAKPVAIPVMPELALAEDFCAPRDWDEDQRRDWAQLQAAATNEGRLRKHALELHALLAAPLASVEAQSRLIADQRDELLAALRVLSCSVDNCVATYRTVDARKTVGAAQQTARAVIARALQGGNHG